MKPVTHFQLRKSFLRSRYLLEYEIQTEVKPELLPGLALGLLELLEKQKNRDSGMFLNLKGRDPRPALLGSLSAIEAPAEELLYFTGNYTAEEDDERDRSEKEEVIPLRLNISTAFEGYTGQKQIIHSIKYDLLSPLDNLEELKSVLRKSGSRIESLRLGLEVFKARFVHAIFGLFPTTVESLLIECAAERLALRVEAVSREIKDWLPLQHNRILPEIDTLLHGLCGLDIQNELSGLIADRSR